MNPTSLPGRVSVSRPKVLQLIAHLSAGGASKVAISLAQLLRDHGCDATLVSGTRTGSEGEMISFARERDVWLSLMPTLVRGPHLRLDLTSLAGLTWLLKRGNFDIIHAHGSKAQVLGLLAGRLAGVPVRLAHVHGWAFQDPVHAMSPRTQMAFLRTTFRWATRIIAVSHSNVQTGLAHGIGRRSQYVVIEPPVEFGRFARPPSDPTMVRRRLGLGPSDRVIGSVMRLASQKAPLDFVEAAARVRARMPEAKFVIVGDGPLLADVRAAVAQRSLQGAVLLLGYRRDVPALLSAFDVFALSSLWEGLPIVYLEAMAAGKPVVGTDVDGASEAVEDGVTGILVPPRDPMALGDAILQVAADPDLAQRMGAAGRRRASAFDVKGMVARAHELYVKLLTAGDRVVVAEKVSPGPSDAPVRWHSTSPPTHSPARDSE